MLRVHDMLHINDIDYLVVPFKTDLFFFSMDALSLDSAPR